MRCWRPVIAACARSRPGAGGQARDTNQALASGVIDLLEVALRADFGAFGGSTLGKMMDGQRLLALFAVLMMVVGALMIRDRARTGDAGVSLSRENLPKLLGLGLIAGALSGFFGIGGGFLIVPSLMLATGMQVLNAIGSSLVSVTAFGMTTAGNYAWSDLVDWPLAGLFIAGGVLGSLLGVRSATLLSDRKGALTTVFAMLIFAVALYMLVRSLALI